MRTYFNPTRQVRIRLRVTDALQTTPLTRLKCIKYLPLLGGEMKLFVLLFLISFSASARFIQSYDFPNMSSLEATLSAGLIEGPSGRAVGFRPLLQKDLPDSYKGPSRFRYHLYQRRGQYAPLVFIHVGLGGESNDGLGRYLAELFTKEGYHVVILGSTFTDSFSAVAGSCVYPGLARLDAFDLYRMMTGVKQDLQRRGVSVSQWGLVGYSYGALVSAHMTEIDQREGYFDFKKVVLINPPVDPLYALSNIDKYYQSFENLTGNQKTGLVFKWNYLRTELKDSFRVSHYQKLLRNTQIDSQRLRAMIGVNFRSKLKDVVFLSQEITDLGLLTKESLGKRKRQAGQYGFGDYLSGMMTRFLLETQEGRQIWQRHFGQHNFSVDSLNWRNGLWPLANTLRNNNRISVIHNHDDFIMKSTDFDFLRSHLGNRLFLFQGGGHLGNLWHPRVQSILIQQMKLGN
jgi:pimeloyl-ACP methyl ester carboxylesterase